MSVKITKHSFKFGVHKYFRGSAHEVRLGTFGEKKDPIGPKAYLAVEGHVRPRHLADEPISVTKADINWNNVSSSDFSLSGNIVYKGVGVDVSHSLSLSRARSADLKLVGFAIGERALKNVLNREANIARRAMEEEGRDARIVSEVWVAMEAQLADMISTGTQSSANVSFAGQGVQLSVGTNSSNASTVTLGTGTTFAYRMHKITDWNRGRTVIEDMEDDYVGMN